MNIDEKIAKLEAFEETQILRRRQASRMTWLAVAFAALVLGTMLFAGKRELATLDNKRQELNVDIARLEEEKKGLVQNNEALRGVNQRLSEENRLKKQVITELAPSPDASATVSIPVTPRIYMHVANTASREVARRIETTLTEQGFAVVGIETVSRVPSVTEVRYYKRNDVATANKIVEVLKANGVVDAEPKWLRQYEDSTAVRPRHFEIWFRATGTGT